jgi:hypothetical protein
MFSPAKALLAGALVFGVGGVLLLAQPSGQPSTGPGAAATDAALIEPVEFTAAFSPASSIRTGTVAAVDGHVEQRGNAWSPTISGMTDPRLDGRLTFSLNNDTYPDGAYDVGTATYRIETDDGAWQGSTPVVASGASDWDASGVVVLVGEGAYEGLYAVMGTDWGEIHGVIFSGPPPEAPTAP